MVKTRQPQAAYFKKNPISGFQLYEGNSIAYYKVGKERIAYDINKSKILRCPFKHCDYDSLGYLGGKFALHHCPKHGYLMIRPQEGIVCTFNKDDKENKKVWSIDELLELGIIEINLYLHDQLVYTSKK